MIVLDSSFIIAYHNTKDVHHAAAARAMAQVVTGRWGRPCLLEYVFLEVVTVLLVRRGLPTATAVATALLQAGDLDFVPCSDLFLETVATFRDQPGERLSFADAAIVTVARRSTPGFVATFDRDFRGLPRLTVIPEAT